jgi:outer membrane receptor protein involved in Fe transport
MKKIFIFLIIAIISKQFMFAQSGVIYGTIKDSINGNYVSYANIAILDEKGNQTNYGGITDEKGNFKMDKIPYNNYIIKIFCMGYATKTITNIKISEEYKKIKLDIQINIDIQVLNDVVIVGNRPLIEFKSDKKIIYIDNKKTAGGESVADFLKSLPEIKVEGDAVTLKTYSPTILVNGKPAGPTMKDLTQVPANLISSVEVITNPSVKYNPEGLGGIINLKTRKMPDGINGMFQANVASNNKYNGAATLNFKNKKWNIFANLYERYYGGKQAQSLNQKYELGNSFEQMRTDINKINRIGTRIGADFEPDSLNSFTLYWEYGKRRGKLLNNSDCNEIYLLTNRQYIIEQNTLLDSREHQICFNYTHTLKNESMLDINLSQSFDLEPSSFNVLYKDTLISNFYSEESYNGIESNLEINYSGTIFKTWELETGLSLDWKQINVSDSLSGNLIKGYNHLFRMDRLINAYYISLSKSVGKFDFTVGLRGEYIFQKLSSSIYKDNTEDYDFFPHTGISYKINDKININLNYGYRIARPTIFELTPYSTINYEFLTHRFIGNPNLKPAYTNSIDLGEYFYFSKFSLSTSLSYMYTKDDIDYFYYQQDNLIYATHKNIAISQKILFNIQFYYHSKLFKIYEPILTARLSQNFYDSPDISGNNIHKSYFNYFFNLYNLFYIPRDFRIGLNFTYYPRTYNYYSTIDDKIDLGFTISKTFEFGLTLQLAVYNILNAKHTETVYGNDFMYKTSLNEYSRAINFGIMYKFGKPIRTRTNVNLNTNRIETQ